MLPPIVAPRMTGRLLEDDGGVGPTYVAAASVAPAFEAAAEGVASTDSLFRGIEAEGSGGIDVKVTLGSAGNTSSVASEEPAVAPLVGGSSALSDEPMAAFIAVLPRGQPRNAELHKRTYVGA